MEDDTREMPCVSGRFLAALQFSEERVDAFDVIFRVWVRKRGDYDNKSTDLQGNIRVKLTLSWCHP
jgi:hypothetical protein